MRKQLVVVVAVVEQTSVRRMIEVSIQEGSCKNMRSTRENAAVWFNICVVWLATEKDPECDEHGEC
ncbi:hypothetical protein Scep_018149 [Stephania cephalantha]|uniref:Uncharacterized protein n=1 Tax=Stephania cephalantha TaxID=152367 RepID=A0AAP0NXL8_9MAGN